MPQSVPRLCHMVLSPDFKGYGFNLHTVKEKPGQFIGQVDEGSPAEKAMLKQGDRIVEVNGVNIANENHKQVRNVLSPFLCSCSWNFEQNSILLRIVYRGNKRQTNYVLPITALH